MTKEELDKLNRELDKSDIGDVLKLIEGSTSESLDNLQEEINFFLEEKEKEEKKEKPKDQSNPFLALIGHYDKEDTPKGTSKSEKEVDKDKPVKSDDWIERTHLRTFAASEAIKKVFTIFDIYKKAHGMVSYT